MERRSSRRRGEASRPTVDVLRCLTEAGSLICPTPAAIRSPVLREDAVLLSTPLRPQQSEAPPTARPKDNNPAVMRYPIAARPVHKLRSPTE